MARAKNWLKRAGCLALLLLWLALMITPVAAFAIARNGQVQVGSSEGSHVRVFLVLADESDGIGFELARSRSGGECQQVRVVFLLWKGESEPASYCQCLDGAGTPADGPACPP